MRIKTCALAAVGCLALVACSSGSGSGSGDQGSVTRSSELSYADEASSRGLIYTEAPYRLYRFVSMNGGAAVEDFNGDGSLDVYLTLYNQPNKMLFNDGSGHFSVAHEGGDQELVDGSGTPIAGDVDGDGDLDLFVGSTNYGDAHLLINDGGEFSDQTAGSGIELEQRVYSGETGSFAYGASFFDLDHDGDLDLLVGEWGLVPSFHSRIDNHRAYLFVNDGSGHFTDKTNEAGLGGLTTSAVFNFAVIDVDGDGWEDLLIAGDFGTARAYRSQEGKRFVDATNEIFTDERVVSAFDSEPGKARVFNAMGSTLADLNGDGTFEWIVTAVGATQQGSCLGALQEGENAPLPPELIAGCKGNRAYSIVDGQLENISFDLGITDGGWGWGVVAQDLDLDGDVDMAMTNGFVSERPAGFDPDKYVVNGVPIYVSDAPVFREAAVDQNRMWINSGEGPWPEVAADTRFGTNNQGRALIGFDADGDGDLDILEINNGLTTPELFMQTTDLGQNWLAVRVKPKDGPPDCIGCTVHIKAGKLSAIRRIQSAGTFEGQIPLIAYFGLGDYDGDVEVTVDLPGGKTISEKVPANKLNVIEK